MTGKSERPTLGCRVTKDEMKRIDELLGEIGQSRSDWLYQLIKQELGETDVQTVRGMSERIAALEKKLTKLSLLIAA